MQAKAQMSKSSEIAGLDALELISWLSFMRQSFRHAQNGTAVMPPLLRC